MSQLAGTSRTSVTTHCQGLFQKKYEPPYELKLSAIPLEVFNHPELEKVDVWNHPLEALPAQIGRLTNLHTLRLNTGRISSIPNELFNLINLTDLNLGYNQLKGISASIQRLSRLEVFSDDGRNDSDRYSGYTRIL